MFWKIIRWGGTAVLVLVAVLALVAGGKKEDKQPEVKPTTSSSFNL